MKAAQTSAASHWSVAAFLVASVDLGRFELLARVDAMAEQLAALRAVLADRARPRLRSAGKLCTNSRGRWPLQLQPTR